MRLRIPGLGVQGFRVLGTDGFKSFLSLLWADIELYGFRALRLIRDGLWNMLRSWFRVVGLRDVG